MSDHTILIIRVMRIFLYISSVFSCHLFLISSASVRSIPFCPLLSPSLHEMFLGISHFLERDLQSFPFYCFPLSFFALIPEEGFLISPSCSLELSIQMGISFLFSFAFLLVLFSLLFVRPPQTTILIFCISFPWGWS